MALTLLVASILCHLISMMFTTVSHKTAVYWLDETLGIAKIPNEEEKKIISQYFKIGALITLINIKHSFCMHDLPQTRSIYPSFVKFCEISHLVWIKTRLQACLVGGDRNGYNASKIEPIYIASVEVVPTTSGRHRAGAKEWVSYPSPQ